MIIVVYCKFRVLATKFSIYPFLCFYLLFSHKQSKQCRPIAVSNNFPSPLRKTRMPYGIYTVLPATQGRGKNPAFTPAGTRFSQPGGIQSWVGWCYVKVHPLEIEPGTCQSQVQRPTAAPPCNANLHRVSLDVYGDRCSHTSSTFLREWVTTDSGLTQPRQRPSGAHADCKLIYK